MRDPHTRDKILDTASRLIRAGGYEALNFGTIAEELGITRANIHHHFKNKENLALQAVNRYSAGLEERFAGFKEKHPGNFSQPWRPPMTACGTASRRPTTGVSASRCSSSLTGPGYLRR
jgi:AcrR family transcriptional regulator